MWFLKNRPTVQQDVLFYSTKKHKQLIINRCFFVKAVGYGIQQGIQQGKKPSNSPTRETKMTFFPSNRIQQYPTVQQENHIKNKKIKHVEYIYK